MQHALPQHTRKRKPGNPELTALEGDSARVLLPDAQQTALLRPQTKRQSTLRTVIENPDILLDEIRAILGTTYYLADIRHE
jgi:hypothetical protein